MQRLKVLIQLRLTQSLRARSKPNAAYPLRARSKYLDALRKGKVCKCEAADATIIRKSSGANP